MRGLNNGPLNILRECTLCKFYETQMASLWQGNKERKFRNPSINRVRTWENVTIQRDVQEWRDYLNLIIIT